MKKALYVYTLLINFTQITNNTDENIISNPSKTIQMNEISLPQSYPSERDHHKQQKTTTKRP